MSTKITTYIISVGVVLGLFLLMRGCGSFKDIASIFSELNRNDTVILTDTVVTVDTIRYNTTKYIPVKVVSTVYDTIKIERILQDTTIAVTFDSVQTSDLLLKYKAYGQLLAIGFDYQITRPDIIKTVTIDRVMPDVKYRLWLGGFSSATFNHYGISAGLTKQKVYIGMQYNIQDNSLMYNIQYNIK